MTESTKLQRLREMHAKLTAGKYTKPELLLFCVADTDGAMVRLNNPDALEVLDRRIAAEEAKGDVV